MLAHGLLSVSWSPTLHLITTNKNTTHHLHHLTPLERPEPAKLETATLRSNTWDQAKRVLLNKMEKVRKAFHKLKAGDGKSVDANLLDETNLARSPLGILDCLPLEMRELVYENVVILNSCHRSTKLTKVFS